MGGISKDKEASCCTHFIELITPLRNQGSPVNLRVALSDNFSTLLILGTPFLVRARMVLHMAENYAFSNTFQRSFDLEYKIPQLRDIVPNQDGQVVKTFVTATSDPTPSTKPSAKPTPTTKPKHVHFSDQQDRQDEFIVSPAQE